MANWKEEAIEALHKSLTPVPQELNGIDWKGGLSDKSERLAQHICAFANLDGGGVLVFGINDDASFADLNKVAIEEISNKLGNIAKNNLACQSSWNMPWWIMRGTPCFWCAFPNSVTNLYISADVTFMKHISVLPVTL